MHSGRGRRRQFVSPASVELASYLDTLCRASGSGMGGATVDREHIWESHVQLQQADSD